MQQITSSKKYQNGIQVFRADAGKELNDFFSVENLVDQKINVLDLLKNPRLDECTSVVALAVYKKKVR